ncbi:MAG: DeoR/GlpR transcriptional regulator [Fusobacteriaceae bacterium]|nr:DeoR/GlpR transcriptional regulator [Fusobacteriaceae bacterium]
MHQEKRLLKILEYLNEHNFMSIHDICKMLDVSRDTARRDILKIVQEGSVIRTHGGISLPLLKNTIKEYKERMENCSGEKIAIARKTLDFIQKNFHYFFDVSTIVSILSREVNEAIWVLTHSLDNIEILSEKKEITVNSIGGCLNRKNRFFYNPDFLDYVNNIRLDIAIFGAAAITSDGIYYVDEEDALVKRSISKKSSRIIVLAEHEKFKLFSYYKGIDWEEIDVIITDKTPPPIFVQIMELNHIELIIVRE